MGGWTQGCLGLDKARPSFLALAAQGRLGHARAAQAHTRAARRLLPARCSAAEASPSTVTAERVPEAAVQPEPAAPEVGQSEAAAPGPVKLNLRIQLVSSLDAVGREEWDRCATGSGEVNPFLLWDFLYALEASKSAVKEEGWLAQHVLVRDDDTGELLGCCPLYLKGHSYGEYVFDSSWAQAYNRFMGANYYPKAQCCVPFTPVTGRRLLVRPGPYEPAVTRALAESLQQVADQLAVSSLHVTFNTEREWEQMGARHGYLQRAGIQYWWLNQREEGGKYTSFDDFLMHLRQSKRKNIRQERKRATADNGLKVRRLVGADIKPEHWDAFYDFYRNTTDRKWGHAYLKRDFFHQLGDRMADRVLLVVAENEKGGLFGRGEIVAGALNLVGSSALYGRNWGCKYGDAFKGLHMELCYYQAIEHAIELGLERVEAGAQGEHKISRGYLPHLTYSSHYIPDPGFRHMVERFLQQERAEIAYALHMLRQEASPYKHNPVSS